MRGKKSAFLNCNDVYLIAAGLHNERSASGDLWILHIKEFRGANAEHIKAAFSISQLDQSNLLFSLFPCEH